MEKLVTEGTGKAGQAVFQAGGPWLPPALKQNRLGVRRCRSPCSTAVATSRYNEPLQRAFTKIRHNEPLCEQPLRLAVAKNRWEVPRFIG